MVRPDGSGLRQIAFSGGILVGCPSWAPDGRRLAYIRLDILSADHDPNTVVVLSAWTVDVSSGTHTKLFDIPREEQPGRLVWSPDGRWFAANRDSGLWIIRPDGTGARQLTKSRVGAASWSPSGREIAFNAQQGIYKIRLNGTGKRLLVAGARLAFLDWGRGTLP